MNQREGSRLKYKSVMKFLVAKMCKPYEIHRRMCNVYGKEYFSQKNLYKWAKYGLAITSQRLKDSPESGKRLILWKRKKI